MMLLSALQTVVKALIPLKGVLKRVPFLNIITVKGVRGKRHAIKL
jgi:hypothetical protein